MMIIKCHNYYSSNSNNWDIIKYIYHLNNVNKMGNIEESIAKWYTQNEGSLFVKL